MREAVRRNPHACVCFRRTDPRPRSPSARLDSPMHTHGHTRTRIIPQPHRDHEPDAAGDHALSQGGGGAHALKQRKRERAGETLLFWLWREGTTAGVWRGKGGLVAHLFKGQTNQGGVGGCLGNCVSVSARVGERHIHTYPFVSPQKTDVCAPSSIDRLLACSLFRKTKSPVGRDQGFDKTCLSCKSDDAHKASIDQSTSQSNMASIFLPHDRKSCAAEPIDRYMTQKKTAEI